MTNRELENQVINNVVEEYFNLMKEMSRKNGEQLWQNAKKIKFFQDIYEQVVGGKRKLSLNQLSLLQDKKPITTLYEYYLKNEMDETDAISYVDKILFNFARNSKEGKK